MKKYLPILIEVLKVVLALLVTIGDSTVVPTAAAGSVLTYFSASRLFTLLRNTV